jgi:hypothetical protein
VNAQLNYAKTSLASSRMNINIKRTREGNANTHEQPEQKEAMVYLDNKKCMRDGLIEIR